MGLGSRGNKPHRIGFRFALQGIRYAFAAEWNVKMHVFAFIAITIISVLFQISPFEWMMVFLVSGLVIITELLNTAVEHLLDYLTPEQHPVVGQIKDVTAGAVFIAAIVAVAVGFVIFLPKIIALF
ncbi:undecaprenol kinase [Paraliobacillus ryukyuensis]|uniref:Undecaprenol kinase n=1 Tax=Paraliobacillus ryukyuensis TaxID=200904 RepID=A0A366EG01_9BACI|nr:diacylglycerol kinase family protein [Paraliobacillus ryukyuensis]RBP01361.1 undecaprenol kinase [Paraliobacillus ryukyuensis]